MEENRPVEVSRNLSPPRGRAPQKNRPYPFEVRKQAVKLHLEEGFTQELVASELGISSAAVYKWTRRYKLQGEGGLKDQFAHTSRQKLPEAVREKILELQQEEPAAPYLPAGDPAANLIYGHKVSRSCGSGVICLQLSVPPDCTRLTLGPSTWLGVFTRICLEPATKVGPALREVLYDRIIKFSPRQ